MNESRFLRVLAGESVDRPPFWFMRQAGRYLPEYQEIRKDFDNFLSFCYTPDAAAEVTLQPLRRFGMDAAILFCDILVIPDALGQEVRFVKGDGPQLEPVTEKTLESLDPGKVRKHLAPVAETIRQVRRSLPPGAALIGFAGAPWTVAAYMLEGRTSRQFSKAKHTVWQQPEMFAGLMAKIERATIDYLLMQIEAGAQAIQLFDSWCAVLPEQTFRQWVMAPARRIVAALRAKHPYVPVIGFPLRAGALAVDYARETGVQAVGIDALAPLDWVRREIQPLACVQGNLDPELLASSAAGTLAAAERLLDVLGEGPLVVNLGHGILPHTPLAHVEALAARLREVRR